MEVADSTIVYSGRVDSENNRRTEEIEFYNENSSFLTLESDIETENPLCISDMDNRFIPFWLLEEESEEQTSEAKRRCVEVLLPWFGEVKLVATNIQNNT